MRAYSVSVRLHGERGPVVWGDTMEAASPAAARAEAERLFFLPLVIDPAWDEGNREAAERLEASCAVTRAKARAEGFAIVATVSRAGVR